MEQKLSKGERTRLLLIQNAIVYFNKFGYHQIRIDELMKTLRLTTGVFYANFESKDQLFSIAIESQIHDLRQFLFFSSSSLSSEEWLQQFVTFYLSNEHRDFVGLICPVASFAIQGTPQNLTASDQIRKYQTQLEGLLNKRLFDCGISQTWTATGILSTCVGAIQLARNEPNPHRSQSILNGTQNHLLKFFEQTQ